MPRKLRLSVILGGGVLVVLLLLAAGLYWASRYEPAFYRQALAADVAVQKKASDEMIRQAMAFQNGLRREGDWQAVFTADEINGWLAFDLQRNHPQALPDAFHDPCVAIEPNRLKIACGYAGGTTSSILCLTVEPYVPQPNVLALRIVRARAGLLPMPLGNVLAGISEAARNAELHLEWRQAEGNPVALVSLPSSNEPGKLAVRIKTVRLSEKEIFIAGSTKRNGK